MGIYFDLVIKYLYQLILVSLYFKFYVSWKVKAQKQAWAQTQQL